MQKSYDVLMKTRLKIREAMTQLCVDPHRGDLVQSLDKLGKAADKHLNALLGFQEEGESLKKLGSGQIVLLSFDLDP